jgi:sterol-4alpha-carboxylate 3-dehydrogenase (decarboxylating)
MAVTRRGSKQRCLVTGGSGFLGRHLVEQLADSGKYDVTVFDIRKPAEGARDDVTYIIGDLRKQEEVDKACAGGAAPLPHPASPRPIQLGF